MNLLWPLVPGHTTNSVSSGPQQHYNNSIMLCASNFCYGAGCLLRVYEHNFYQPSATIWIKHHHHYLPIRSGRRKGIREKQPRRKRRCKLCDKNGGDYTKFICNGRIKGRNRCQFYNATSCKERWYQIIHCKKSLVDTAHNTAHMLKRKEKRDGMWWTTWRRHLQ